MYLAFNLTHHITTLSGVLILTASHMLSQLLKCTGSPPRLLMRLNVPHIHILLLFWQPLIP